MQNDIVGTEIVYIIFTILVMHLRVFDEQRILPTLPKLPKMGSCIAQGPDFC